MKKLLILGLFLALATSCGDESHSPNPGDEKTEVWVCHNPLSELHGSVCEEEVSVFRGNHQPCFWSGHQRVRNSFCWLLERKDCTGPADQRLEWQERHCPLLEK